ncbi:GntR family transcriptional regulator [Streptomyces sp. NPDC012486]|uniref:GntR family transcriptional regulator n=1 Tax=Streptomyces TaxID=1883 RepID=UPI00106ED1D3|nr:GntR family transcriptional regulator [Streptomyces sp. S501]QBR07702.1 GntR family transcriptional regulator [Streptomyces sp. S501]
MTSHGSAPRDAKFQYRWVADELRKEINSEAYGPGERLATQEELASRFGVSRATVSQALAILRKEELIVTRQGSGSYVASEPDETRQVPAPTGSPEGGVWAVVSERVPPVLLRPYLVEAFEANVVKLDVFSMTTESLAARVVDQKDRIVAGEVSPPRSITARLLLPNTESTALAIPRQVSGEDDPRVRARLGGILHSHVTMLRSALFELRRLKLVEEVDVQVRLVPFAPQMKLYILNNRVVLQGFYIPEEGTATLPDGEEIATYDAYGTGATLYPFRASADSTPEQAGVVRAARKFFTATWENLATRAAF